MPLDIASCTLYEPLCRAAFCCEDVCVFSVHFYDVVLVLFCDRIELLKMTVVKEQRICIKFCSKLGKTASKTHRMLKEAFGDNSLGQTQTYEWFKRLKNRWMSVVYEERSGRPSTGTTTENVANVLA